MISVRLKGIDDIYKGLSGLSRLIKESSSKYSKELAEQFREYVSDIVSYQLLDWTPLQEDYLKIKLRETGESDIFIRSRNFLESLSVMEVSNGWSVGCNDPDVGLYVSFVQLGAQRGAMGPRPLFEPAMSKFRGEVITDSFLFQPYFDDVEKIWRNK